MVPAVVTRGSSGCVALFSSKSKFKNQNYKRGLFLNFDFLFLNFLWLILYYICTSAPRKLGTNHIGVFNEQG